MKDGIYAVSFRSSMQEIGTGIAIFQQGKVNGGDPGYTYTGTVQATGDKLDSRLNIHQWDSAVPSVFGAIKSFALVLNGTHTNDTFEVNGTSQQVPGATIQIRGRFIGALAE